MRIRRIYATIWLPLVVAFVPYNAVAFAQTAKTQALDVILALDNSGSMKQNDPNGLVKQAAAEFARRLPPDSQLGIVIFDQRVTLALGLTRVSSPEFQSKLTGSLNRVDYSGRWTDIPGGIERAIYSLTHDGRPEALHSIVFFTDGIVETGDRAKDLDRSKWLRENLAVEAKQHGIRIFGVAFTEGADYELIQAVAQTTGGEHYRVLNSSDVSGAFERISQQVMQPLPVTAPPPGTTPTSQNSWLAPVAALVVIVLLAFFWMRRRAQMSAPPEAQDVPSADFAHLIDVGGISGVQRVAIRKRRLRVGRDASSSEVCIDKTTVSSRHASIDYRDGAYYLRDLRSFNGTFVNGKKFSDSDAVREVMLKSGDHVRFDVYEFIFHLDALGGKAGADGAMANPIQTQLGGGAPPSAQAQRPAKPDSAAATIPKPKPASDDPAGTLMKDEFCPIHAKWKATELCLTCKVAKCKTCMVENSNPQICLACAKKARNLT